MAIFKKIIEMRNKKGPVIPALFLK